MQHWIIIRSGSHIAIVVADDEQGALDKFNTWFVAIAQSIDPDDCAPLRRDEIEIIPVPIVIE